MKILKQVPKEKLTPVVFRVWNTHPRVVIAFFPTLPADNFGYLCESYEHFGQHGPADYSRCIKASRLATRKEAAPLLRELRQNGYELKVVKRATPAMRVQRAWEDLVT